MEKTTKTITTAVVVLIFVTAAAVFALLFLIPSIALNDRLFDTAGVPAPFMVTMYVGSFAALWFLKELFSIMVTVRKGDPFVKKNVSALARMAVCCIVAAAALACMLFIYGWYQHFSITVCIFILFFGALCAYTLSRVFDRAVEYKAENDLTV